MKKFVLILGAAGLMTLGACEKKTPRKTPRSLPATTPKPRWITPATTWEAVADNATTDAGKAAADNASDNLHDAADAAKDASENKAEAIHDAAKK